MKTGVCPKCSSKELYEVDEALVIDQDSRNGVYPFTITAAYGMYGKDMANARIAVGARAYVCVACAYTELYARDTDVLERLARSGAGNVRRVTRT